MLDARLCEGIEQLRDGLGVFQIDLCMNTRSWVESEVIDGLLAFVILYSKKFWLVYKKPQIDLDMTSGSFPVNIVNIYKHLVNL